MKKIFIILIIIVLTINFSSLSFADSIYVSNNKEAIKKNYIKAIDDISIEKNIIINSNFDVNKIKDDYYNNRAYFSEVVDNFIISADESGYSYSYSDEEYICC